MCRTTAGPLLAMMGVAGTAAGVGLAVIRERIDRRADSKAAKKAAEERSASEPDASEESSTSDTQAKH
jgi:hypothetical protein